MRPERFRASCDEILMAEIGPNASGGSENPLGKTETGTRKVTSRPTAPNQSVMAAPTCQRRRNLHGFRKLNVASFSVSMWWQPSTFHKVIRHLFVLDHRNAIGYRKISFLNRQFVVCLTPCSIFSVSSSNPERNRIDNAVKARRRNNPARDPSTKS